MAIKTNSEPRPFWTTEQQIRYLHRTDTSYNQVELEALEQRFGENKFLKQLATYLPDVVIAGGAPASWFSGQEIHDADLFFTSPESFSATEITLRDPPPQADALQGYTLTKKTQRYHLYQKFAAPDIQLLKLAWYKGPEYVIDTFDFTVAMVAISSGQVVFHPLAFLDIARKRLVLHRLTFPASTLRRLVKYTQKGYLACPGFLAQLSEECAKVLGEDPNRNTENGVYID